jgi:hypothetical protein
MKCGINCQNCALWDRSKHTKICTGVWGRVSREEEKISLDLTSFGFARLECLSSEWYNLNSFPKAARPISGFWQDPQRLPTNNIIPERFLVLLLCDDLRQRYSTGFVVGSMSRWLPADLLSVGGDPSNQWTVTAVTGFSGFRPFYRTGSIWPLLKSPEWCVQWRAFFNLAFVCVTPPVRLFLTFRSI